MFLNRTAILMFNHKEVCCLQLKNSNPFINYHGDPNFVLNGLRVDFRSVYFEITVIFQLKRVFSLESFAEVKVSVYHKLGSVFIAHLQCIVFFITT